MILNTIIYTYKIIEWLDALWSGTRSQNIITENVLCARIAQWLTPNRLPPIVYALTTNKTHVPPADGMFRYFLVVNVSQ